jgi:RNA polymerase sigma-70 factor (ECF subfamily)
LEKEFTALVAGHQGIIHKVCRMYCRDPDDAGICSRKSCFNCGRVIPVQRRGQGNNLDVQGGSAHGHHPFPQAARSVKHQPFSYPRHDLPDDASDGAAEQQESLRVAMSHLDKFDKAVLMLYLDDKPYREIADIMGISETYVGVKLNRIKRN